MVTSKKRLILQTIDSELEINDIDEIILVGGSTFTPIIRTELMNHFGNKLNLSVKPHEAGNLMSKAH